MVTLPITIYVQQQLSKNLGKILEHFPRNFFLEINKSVLLFINHIQRPKRKIPLFLEMWVTRQIFTWAATNLFFLTNLIEIFK